MVFVASSFFKLRRILILPVLAIFDLHEEFRIFRRGYCLGLRRVLELLRFERPECKIIPKRSRVSEIALASSEQGLGV